MQNLDDSEEFFEVVQTSSNLSQTNITINNVKAEILLLFNKNSEDIDKVFEIIPESLPLQFKNVSLLISPMLIDLDNYYYIYDKKDDLVKKLYEDEIYYPDDFIKLINDNNISNFRQLDYIIDKYVVLTKDTNILNIKDKFTFIKNENNTLDDANNSRTVTYISSNYEMNINGLNSHVDMLIEVENKKSKIKYFDFYFRNK